MKHLISILIFLLVSFLLSTQAFAQDCEVQDYELDERPDFDCPGPGENDLIAPTTAPASVPVAAGETVVALWDGALVHRDRLIYMGLRIRGIRRLRWLDTQLSLERAEIEAIYRDERDDAVDEYCDQRVQHYRDQATAARDTANRATAWYRSFYFGLAVGLVISGVLIALAAYVVTVI